MGEKWDGSELRANISKSKRQANLTSSPHSHHQTSECFTRQVIFYSWWKKNKWSKPGISNLIWKRLRHLQGFMPHFRLLTGPEHRCISKKLCGKLDFVLERLFVFTRASYQSFYTLTNAASLCLHRGKSLVWWGKKTKKTTYIYFSPQILSWKRRLAEI